MSKKLISLVLVLCLASATALPSLAAGSGSLFGKIWGQYIESAQPSSGTESGLGGALDSVKNWLWAFLTGEDSSGTSSGGNSGEQSQSTTQIPTTTPSTGTVSTPTAGTDGSAMTLVEDASTVENGDMLRASTYTLRSNAAQVTAADGTTTVDAMYDAEVGGYKIKYYDVTLFNYNTEQINAATHQLEVADGTIPEQWEGLYFSAGNPDDESYTYTTSAAAHADLTWAQVQTGTYYSDAACTTPVTVSPVTEQQTTNGYTKANVTCGTLIPNSSSSWVACTGYYYTPDNGVNYYPVYAKREGYYLYTYTWGYSTDGGANVSQVDTQSWTVSSDSPNITVYTYGSTTSTVTTGYTLTAGSAALAVLSGTDTTQKVGVTLYTAGGTGTTDALPYANYNYYYKYHKTDTTDNTNADANGQKTWTGLAQSTLDANQHIVLNVPDAGIFDVNSVVSGKTVYTDVQVPFVYDSGTKWYSFDTSKYGVFFKEDSEQGSTAARSGGRLYFNTVVRTDSSGNEVLTQTNNTNYGDGSTTVWMPFNPTTSIAGQDACDYHFGMSATVPFTMTSNGRMNANNDTSEAITFKFSGDDDVWVFIDGQLVIDLGGIHNRLDATIDFAANTVTYTESNTKDYAVGSYNDSTFATSQALFGNLIAQDRVSFSATDDHYLTIFYLERGGGSSNAQISFNLPVKDNLTVHKVVDGQFSVNEDGSTTVTDLSNLTAEQLSVLNNLNFGFTVYKNDAALANATYSLLNANGIVIATPSTDANGHFYLKNGQTAKFIGEFDNTNGDTYYVVEDVKNGFIKTDYAYSFNAAGSGAVNYNRGSASYTYYTMNEAHCVTDTSHSGGTLESNPVTVIGGSESPDSLSFICKNYMNASLPRPSALPNDDKVVIDYGLSVIINLASNDYHLGDSYSYSFGSTSGTYGTFVDNGNGTITYTLNRQLTGVEVIPYTMNAYATATDGRPVTASGTANIYIIPATSMYYEEDFAGLVTYTGSWETVGIAETAAQEPGVVGTVGDSPYGSDAAYLNDSGDSNGSSKYVSTANASAQFSYTFTGTGTSFFARTSNNSAYLRVVVSDASGNVLETYYRNTVYKDADSAIKGSLYNIPVYTYEAPDTYEAPAYGTYTVTVSIANVTMAPGYGSDFWLDGIRVMNPLNSGDTNASVANAAYAADAEANMAVVTLRDKLLSSTWDGFVVFTDTNGEIQTAEDYTSIGPKEEVYLYSGQSVSFSLTGWDPNTNEIYLGMKAPKGSAVVSINGTNIMLSNAADCYYGITDYATVTTDSTTGVKTATFIITAGSDALVSLTNIKVTGNAAFVIIPTTTPTLTSTDYYYEGYSGDDEDPQAE